jgi:hypothetical protein
VASSREPGPPPPTADPGAAFDHTVTPQRDGLDVEITLRGTMRYVTFTAWLDANGNGKVDRGDLVGTLAPPVLARDRGLCAGNLTETPPVPMRPAP